MGAFSVLQLLDGVVIPAVYGLFFPDHGIRNVIDQCPADSAATAGVDETVLRTGVQRIFSIDELRMKHYIALLRGGPNVGQTLPSDQVVRAGYGRCGYRGRKVAGPAPVFPLGAEYAVDPAVFVGCESHVVNVHVRIVRFRHDDRFVPETKIVNAVRAFGDGEKGFAVGSLYPYD